MQRQSLGSPGRGTVSKDDTVSKSADPKRRNSSPSLFVGDDEVKPEKPVRCHSQPEKLIHLIPILVLLCFFILYLSSHDPSSKDLAQFNGFKHPEKIIDATDIDSIGRVDDNQVKGNGVFAIRSLRNLQEEVQGDTQKYRTHRKLGDF